MNPAIEIPARMAKLDRDRRGYPVPFTVYRDSEGRPHFTINEEHLRQKVIAEDLCSICGQRLLRGRWFVGGNLSAFHPNGAYLDPPMHDECAHFALRVCPYLATPSYGKYIEARTLSPGDPLPTSIDPNASDTRPEVFVAVFATGQKKIADELGHPELPSIGMTFIRFLKPRQPYLRCEYWRRGEQISEAEAQQLFHSPSQAYAANEVRP